MSRALWLKLALFAGAALLALFTQPVWRVADLWLVNGLQQWRPLTARDDLVLLELPGPAATADFRRVLARALQQLAERHPARVVVDVNLTEGEGADGVLQGLRALAAAGARVYAGVQLDRASSDTQARAAYEDTALAGVGHTDLIPLAGLHFFEPRKQVPLQGFTQHYRFLPLLLAGPQTLADDDAPRQLVVPPPGARLPALRALPDGGLDTRVPAPLDGRTVLVASTERECRLVNGPGCSPGSGWSGPQLLYWALTDLTSAPDQQQAIRPVADGLTPALLGLASAALVVALQALALRQASARWSPLTLERRLPWLSAAAWLLLMLLLAVLVLLVAHGGRALPLGFAVLLATAALLLAHWHARGHLAEALWLLRRRADSEHAVADIDVFISYSHEPANAAWVERELLAPLQALRNAQGQPLRIFFDRGSIQVGQDWFRRINLSLLGTRCLLCVWSDDYHLRDYCRWELEYGFRRAAEPGFLFLPVLNLSPGATLDDFYRPYVHARQYEDARDSPDAVARLLEQLATRLGATRPGS